MKKILAILMVGILIFGCAACGKEVTEPADYSSIIATFSVNSTEKDFIVEVQDLGGVYEELYDKGGLHIKFYGKDMQIEDNAGHELEYKDLSIGDTLEVHYDGKLYKKNPKTLKVYKIVRIG